MALSKIGSSLLDFNSDITLSGTTPKLTIGDAGAEDTAIVFDGNAQDFYIGLDDSADDLVIGLGSAVGTTPAIEIDENQDIKFAQSIGVGQAASSTVGEITAQTMKLLGTTPTLTIGDAGAEDTRIVFDGNAQDFYIGLDDSADDLLLGVGSAVGTTPAIAIDENAVVNFTNTPTVATAATKFAGKESIWVPAGAMYPSTTNPCSDLTQVETTALRPDLKCLDFDASSDEFAQFAVAFPKSWNEGTVSFKAYFTGNSTNTGNVAFKLAGVGLADGELTNIAFGTAVQAEAKAHSGVAYNLNITRESGAITIAGVPSAEEYVFFEISRDVSEDNFSADALLLGIKLFFTTNARLSSEDPCAIIITLTFLFCAAENTFAATPTVPFMPEPMTAMIEAFGVVSIFLTIFLYLHIIKF